VTYVAALEAVALIAVCLAFARVIQQMIREHARERSLLTNQLLHLAGRTWQAPPQSPARPVTFDDEQTLIAELDLVDPAQLPSDYN
jgi:hypothetical protein